MSKVIQVDDGLLLFRLDKFLCRCLVEENMISSPENPHRSLISSSVREEQSTLQPSSRRIFRMPGVGVALTAKYS